VADDTTPSAPEEAAEEQAPEAVTEEPAPEAVTEEPAPAPEAESALAEAEASEQAAAADTGEQPASEEPGTPAASEEPAAESPAAPPEPEPEPKPARPPVTGTSAGTGRRKESVARVRLVPGTGQFYLGGRTLEQVFPNRAHRMEITAPLRLVDHEQDIDVLARLTGGGVAGQAGALRHGIARALVDLDPGLRPALKAEGFLTRDSREKERRKYGLKKARKAPQYSKR